MKNLFALFAAFILFTSVAFAQNGAAKTAQSNNLVSLLPASDAVATVNLKRMLNEAVPRILASQPAKLAEINAKIDEVKTKTGIDLRQFEQMAIGLSFKQVRAGVTEAEPVAVLRGNYNANALLDAVKTASNSKHRQETIGGKTVTIFSIPEAAKDAAKNAGKGSRIFGLEITLQGEIAVTSLDSNTVAFGKLPQIQALLAPSAKSRVDANLSDFINRNPNALLNAAGKFSNGLSSFVKFGNPQIDSTLGMLRQIFGTFDMNAGNASMLFVAQTAEAAQAKDVEELLNDGRQLATGFLSMKKTDKNEILLRILESVKISRNANTVQLQADIAEADLNVLVVVL